MGNNDELIRWAFEQIQAEGPPEIGQIVGSYRDLLAYRLVDIDGEIAICDLPDGTVKRFLLSEIADVNKVKDLAVSTYLQPRVDAILRESGSLN
jgi:hypothetical protein